jgi:hypothetical protein
MSWTTFLEEAPAADHAVQVYDDLAELAASVGSYLDAGFRAGEPALVLATAEHWPTFAAALETHGWDPERLRAEGKLTCCDADETLRAFMQDDLPSAERFEQVVGALVDDIAERVPNKTIRAFGEMVDVLWQQGRERGAIALEELWNELAESRRFALLCGYQLDIFDIGVQATALPELIRTHSHPRPVADAAKLAAAVDRALADILGPAEAGQVYLRVAEQVPRTQLPRAQAVLTWLTREDAATAGRVLDRARTLYSAV